MKKKKRVFLTVLLCFSMIWCMTITSFAAFFEGWGGILYDDYGITSTYAQDYNYFTYNYLSGYAQSNNMPYDFNIVNNSGLMLLFNSTANEVYNGFSSIENPTEYYTSVDTTINVETMPIVVVGRSGGTQNLSTQITWMRLSGSGKFAIVDNYIVSDSAFTVYMIGNGKDVFIGANGAAAFCNYVEVNTADSNGLYKTAANTVFINGLYNSSDFRLIFTDIPCYLSTISGNSGFQSINDFTFVADNVNYNYLLLDNIVADPQAPVVPDDPWWDDAKHFLNFKVSSLFGWNPDSKKLTHNMTFNWNEDMMLNPDFYVLNLSYRIVYQDQNMNAPDEFYWIANQHEFRRNLMDIANPTLNSKYFMSMDFSEFVNDSNETFLSYYLNTINSVTGTYVQNINLNTTFEDWYTTLNNYLNVFNSIEDISYKMTKVREEIATQITTFKIYAYISVGRVADPNANTGVIIGGNPGNTEQDFRSGINVSSYNCLSAKNTVESNDNVNNLYPPEEGQLPSVITPDTNYPGNTISGGNFAQGGQGGNATVNINTDPMSGWSPEVIKSIKDTFDFIENQLSEYKDNNFLGFMIESYKLIPDPFWNMVALAGGVITGFAIIRFIRNK